MIKLPVASVDKYNMYLKSSFLLSLLLFIGRLVLQKLSLYYMDNRLWLQHHSIHAYLKPDYNIHQKGGAPGCPLSYQPTTAL
jgi:hypothetical protein